MVDFASRPSHWSPAPRFPGGLYPGQPRADALTDDFALELRESTDEVHKQTPGRRR